MNRPLALLCALILAWVSVSSACFAQVGDWVHFTLDAQHNSDGRIEASFSTEGRGRHENNWSTGFLPSDLVGLEVSSFHAPGTRPLHFAIVREAERLDCTGYGGENRAGGNCAFVENGAFTHLLVDRALAGPPVNRPLDLSR